MSFKNGFAFNLPPQFIELVKTHITQDGTTIINLRNREFGQKGGVRPVELSIEKVGDDLFINYITDFTYVGLDFVKGCDFSFESGYFSSDGLPIMSIDYSVMEFFEIYLNNLGGYISMKSFDEIKTEHSSYTNYLIMSAA